jgi:adenylate kinase family enzyme
VTVNGTSGAGKSTLARRVGELLDLPYTEVDSLFHGPGWTPNPDFVEAVDAITSGPRWICEYQYDAARPMLRQRADLVVWLDLPTHMAMWRVTRRTVARRLRRQELWNGNREGPLRDVLTHPDHVVRYAWSTRHDAEERARGLLASLPRLPVVHLRSTRQVRHWLRGPLAEMP